MDELTLNPEFLQGLVFKGRALMAQEGMVMPDAGGNPIDDEGPAVLQDSPDNPQRAEIVLMIEDLAPDQQAELVALMWVGRGDYEPEEWGEALRLALDRAEPGTGPGTADYLLTHPHFADHLDEGVDRLYGGSDFMETGAY